MAKRTGNTGRLVGDALELLQTLDIVLQVLTASARTCSGDGIGCLNQTCYDGLGLYIAVVCLDGMDDRLGFLVLLGKVYANLNVAALNLVVNGLADIMQQTCTACRNRIEAEFAGHHAGNVCHLDGVLQDVLTITGAVAQAAENLDQLRMNAVDAGLEGSTLAFALDDLLNLTASLVNHFPQCGPDEYDRQRSAFRGPDVRFHGEPDRTRTG